VAIADTGPRSVGHPLEKLNIGVVGAAGRGASFRAAFDAHPRTRIHAVCDIRQDALAEVAERLGASEMYTDYAEMLERSEVDAVVIGTPMQFHTPQAIAALERNVHVLSEVTAAVSMDECRALVAAAQRSQAVYMMAENCAYTKPNVLVKELVRRGLFGEVYYAEGEYLHELKELNEITPWRRRPHVPCGRRRASTASPTARTAWGRSCNGRPRPRGPRPRWRATGWCASAARAAGTTTWIPGATRTRTRTLA
jgi:hypothetical protein